MRFEWYAYAFQARSTAAESHMTCDQGRHRLQVIRPPGRESYELQMGLAAPAPTVTSAFGSSDPALSTPRGRWYLKLRPTTATPAASSAEASVSPGCAATRRPSKRTAIAVAAMLESLGCRYEAPPL